MLFFLPAAIDTAVIIMSAKDADWFWLYPIVAVIGSVAGALFTFEMGHKLGEAGLQRWISPRRMNQVRSTIDAYGVVAMGMTAAIPPPFPLTPFVLTSGALGLDKRKFFLALAASRFVRFGAESILAITYGRRILKWLRTDIVEYVVAGLMIMALAGSAITIVQVIRKVR